MLRALRENWAILIVASALCVLGTVAFLTTAQQQVQAAERAGVEATARTLAATLDPASSAETDGALASAIRAGLAGAWLLEADGRVRMQLGTAFPGVSWHAVFDEPAVTRRLNWEGHQYWVATVQAATGERVILAHRLAGGIGPVAVLLVTGLGLGAWLLLAVVVLMQFRHRGADPELMALAKRLANRPDDVRGRAEALEDYGEQVRPLLYLTDQLSTACAEREEATAFSNAFLQVGSHYALVCSLDGRLLNANPAFMARTGLNPDALHGRSVHELGAMLPFARLLALAQRSLAERATLSGIPCTLTLADEARPVDVSLRAVPGQRGAVVLMVIGDRHREHQLERQIDQFTDAVELMVDQRVAQLTAGRATLETVLEDAGIALFLFDRTGATEALNAPAEGLTGCTRFTLHQFGQAAALLCPDLTQREAFHAWFWKGESCPFPLDTFTMEGRRSLLWITGCERRGGEIVRRALVGIPSVPASETGDPARRLEALAAALDPLQYSPAVRPYVGVIREAVRRIGSAGVPGGDGAATIRPHIPR